MLSALCRLLCLALLRGASLLVPTHQRTEWIKEWRAELWHVRQACLQRTRSCWSVEREIAAFCLGAFEDARCLRQHASTRTVPLATTMGSAPQCILFLTAILAFSGIVALLLPPVRAQLRGTHYRDARNLMLLQDAQYTGDATPTIQRQDFFTWKARHQHLFDAFAFYRIVREPLTQHSAQRSNPAASRLAIVHASSNLLELLGTPIRFALPPGRTPDGLPRLILSDAVWRRDFARDENLSGRIVWAGSHPAVLAGVAASDAWRLPGAADAWLLLPDGAIAPAPASPGFVLAHWNSSSDHAIPTNRSHLSTLKADGKDEDLLSIPLTERTRPPWDVFLFAVFLACVALPATTSLPLGEYPVTSRKLCWSTRLRRWSFLAAKIALLLPIVFFVSLDLASLRGSLDVLTAQSIQIVSAFSLCLFGLRWVLRDQRQRCPVCLGKLTHPARVGQTSRTFLDWNGTEWICVSGHGLLHIPEMPTSWFSTQRWLYLDPSWDVLFPDPGLAPTG
jgi:hypothetical protein